MRTSSPLEVPNRVLLDALDYAETRLPAVFNAEGVFSLQDHRAQDLGGYLETEYDSIAYAGYPERSLSGGVGYDLTGLLRTPDNQVLLLALVVMRIDGTRLLGSVLLKPDWVSMQQILQISRRVAFLVDKKVGLTPDAVHAVHLAETFRRENDSRYNQAPEPE